MPEHHIEGIEGLGAELNGRPWVCDPKTAGWGDVPDRVTVTYDQAPGPVNRAVFHEESGAPEVYERCPATHDEFGQCFLDEGSPEHHGMHESELGEWKA